MGLGRPFYSLGASEWLGRGGMVVDEWDILSLTETRQKTARVLAVGYMTLSRWPGLYDLTRSSLDKKRIQLTDREKLAERLRGKNILSVSPIASGELVEAGIGHSYVAGDFLVHGSVRSPMVEKVFVPREGLVEGGVVVGGAMLPTVFSQRGLGLSDKIRQLESGRVPEVGFMVNGAGADMVSWLRSVADAIREEKIRARFFVGTSLKLSLRLRNEATRLRIGEIEIWRADNLSQGVQLKSWVTAESDIMVSPTANENILARPTIFEGVRNAAERANARMATSLGWGIQARESGEIAELLARLSDNNSLHLRQMLRSLENNVLMNAGEKMAKNMAMD